MLKKYIALDTRFHFPFFSDLVSKSISIPIPPTHQSNQLAVHTRVVFPLASVPHGTPSLAPHKCKVAKLGDFATPSTENRGSHTLAPTNTVPPFSGLVHFLAMSKKDGTLIPHYQPTYSSYTYPTPTTPVPQQSWSTAYSTLSAALQYKPTETATSP